MISLLKLFIRYIINLGLFNGIISYFQVEILKFSKFKFYAYNLTLLLRPESSDKLVFREIFLHKIYDFPIEAAEIIIDGGANIGYSSLYFANRFQCAKIYALEPDNSNYKILVNNAKHVQSVFPIEAAIWNSDSMVSISNSDGTHWNRQVTDKVLLGTRQVQGINLYSLMKKFNLPHIDILKLDVEGSEKEIFSSNFSEWLPLTKNIIIELHDWIKPDCSMFVFRAISQYNFNTVVKNGMLLLINRAIK